MKIVYVSDSAIPSASPNSIHVMKMCQAFAQLGHEVTLYAKNTTACFSNIEDIYEFYSVERNFRIDLFPARAFKGSGSYYNLSLSWRLLYIKADLIYTRSITAAFLLLFFRRHVVFEVHEPFEGKGQRLKRMFRFIVYHSRLTKLLVISDALKEYYIKHFLLPEKRVLVAHDGADPFVNTSPAINSVGFKIGYVGSLFPGKGMEIILPLAKLCTGVRFHIVGGNKKQISAYTEKADALGITNLIFHGFKSQLELPAYISSFDAVIAPYTAYVKVSEKKGANNLALWMSPLKIFEYMSAAKPIIASDLPVIREILQHEQTALLCDPEKLESWAVAVRRLLHDQLLRFELSKNAYDSFLEKYTWKKRAEQILTQLF